MEDLDTEGLALALKDHLHSDIVKMLRDQGVSGSNFLGLNVEILKLFQFPIGFIIDIMKLVSEVKAGTKVLSSNSSLRSKDNPGTSQFNTTCQSESDSLFNSGTAGGNISESGGTSSKDAASEDAILSEYLDDEYLKTLSPYEKISLCAKVELWKRLKVLNAPAAGSIPNLPVPAKYLKANGALNATRTHTIAEDSKTSSSKRKSLDINDFNSEQTDCSDEADSDNDEERHSKVVCFEAPPLQKTSEELKAISSSLPQYDIESVLLDDENSKERTKNYVEHLKNGKLLGSKERKRMFRKLGNFLCFKIVDDPYKTTASMREGLAKSIVVTYPQYQKGIDVPGTTPWSHIWNKKGGNLSNVIKRIQTNLPDSKRAKKGKAPKRKKKKKMPTSNVDIVQLGLLLPNKTNRLEIFDSMKKTYQNRCEMRDRGASVTEIIKDYEHLVHYDGELIELEFKTMYPTAKDMCPELARYIPKILKNWYDSSQVTSFPDDIMKALHVLALRLPHTINGRSSVPVESEILLTTKTGVTVENFTQEWRQKKNGPVQPYILAVMGQMRKEVLKYYIVLEDYHLDVGRIPFLRCIDWLFKCYFVFDVKYPKTWSQFFRFLQSCFYQIYYNGKDDIPPTSLEVYNQLLTLQ